MTKRDIYICLLDGPDEADYIPSTASLTFGLSTRNQSVCANFVIVDDNVAEDNEYFLVSLSTSDDADVIPGEATAEVVIRDNDGIYLNITVSLHSNNRGHNMNSGRLHLAHTILFTVASMNATSFVIAGVGVRLAENILSVIEGESGDVTLANICVFLVDIHDSLERDVHFNLSIIPLNSACKFLHNEL